MAPSLARRSQVEDRSNHHSVRIDIRFCGNDRSDGLRQLHIAALGSK
jgi:hypothetical protein